MIKAKSFKREWLPKSNALGEPNKTPAEKLL